MNYRAFVRSGPSKEDKSLQSLSLSVEKGYCANNIVNTLKHIIGKTSHYMTNQKRGHYFDYLGSCKNHLVLLYVIKRNVYTIKFNQLHLILTN